MLSRRPLLAGAASLAAWPAAAAPDDADLVAASALSAGEGYDPDIAIEQRMQDYINDSGLGAKRDAGLLFVEFGQAGVSSGPENPDWIKFRSVAYAEALLDAQAKLVEQQRRSISSEVVRSFFTNGDTPPAYVPGPNAGQSAELVRKILAVAGGRLDNELRGLGLDPKQYQDAPPAQQTSMLSNRMQRTVTTKAFGDSIGACPVKTFEGHGADGHYCVGAVIVTSPHIRELVQQIATARGNFQPDPARAQNLAALYADPKALISDFGVRQLFDANGLPVIVSFAQWASSTRNPDPAMAALFREAARHQAESMADGQIAEFIKGSVTVETASATGKGIDSVASVLPDDASTTDTKHALDQYRKGVIQRAQVQITGLTTLRSWTGRHPASSTPIIGVIRMWSASSEQAMRTMMAGPTPKPKTPATPTDKGTSGLTEGRDLMKAEDF